MERFCTNAIILSRTDFGEADRIVTLLAEDKGRIPAFARGARRSKRRFAGVLETGALIQATLRTSKGSLFTLEDACLLDGHDKLRRDLGAMARAAYACELTKELCRENVLSGDLFQLLKAFLAENAGTEELMCFELGALGASGIRPGLDRCAVCNADDGVELRFDPGLGGRLCAKCARMHGSKISQESLGILAALQQGVAGNIQGVPDWIRAEAREALTNYVVHYTGRPLKSFEFMRKIGVEA